MHYTSGTTGRPKGVTTGLWDDATARAVYEDEAAVWHFDPTTCTWCARRCTTPSPSASRPTRCSPGGSLAVLGRFDAATALDVLRRHRPTTAFLVPTHLQRILQHPGLGADETFDSFRLLAHAGAPCPESVKRATMARVPPGVVWEFYGSTEAQFTVCPPEDWLEHPGTVGRARAGRRLATRRRRLGRRPAELVTRRRRARSGATMPDFARFSYWRDPRHATAPGAARPAPSATSAASMPDGYLYLTGRRHDLIISGGVNVYPAEVENVLAAVAGVRRSRCSACPTSSGANASAPPRGRLDAGAEGALRAAASARLAPYKRPKSYIAAATCPTPPRAS